MDAVSKTQAQSPLQLRLAHFLSVNQEWLTQDWIESVLQNPEIPSAKKIAHEQLVDHMPMLFENLADVLEQGSFTGEAKNNLVVSARTHGHHRWEQNYRFEELAREIQLIRSIILLNGLSAFGRENSDFAGEAKKLAKRLLHHSLNESGIAAAQQFVDEQQGKISEMNRELQAANEQMQDANDRLTTVNQSRLKLTRTVCHELANILNGLGAAVGVLDGETDEAIRAKMLRILHRNVHDMGSLLQQLLSYSVLLEGRRQSTIESFNLHWLFEELVATYEPLAQASGLQFKARFDASLTEIVSYRLKIKQVASNLLSNAIKYGRRPDNQGGGLVSYAFEASSADHWKIVVEDEGIGIPPGETERIFEEFHRVPSASENVHGTGLGLTITKALVDLLCGRIEVRSLVGKGTRFEVILPRTIDSPCAQQS